MNRVSVLLASANTGLRQSLQMVLENEGWIEVVGVPGTETDALDMVETLIPQVVIVDFDSIDSGLVAGRRILEIKPNTQVIVLGANGTSFKAKVEASLVELISRDASTAELLRSIAKTKRQRLLH